MSGNGREGGCGPDPEVVPVARRRQYSVEEKLRILEEADACSKPGEMGALLRREGIYSSHITRWRQQRDRGMLNGLGSEKRGPKASSEIALGREVARLRRENEQLRARLDQAETIIEVQKKLSQLIGPSGRANEREER